MASKHEAEKFLRDGLTPSQIAERMGISIGSVIQYLHTRIGEGAMRLSEVYFCLPAELREALKQAAKKKHDVPDIEFLQQRGLTREDFEFYRPIRSRSVFAGDSLQTESHFLTTDGASRTHDRPAKLRSCASRFQHGL